MDISKLIGREREGDADFLAVLIQNISIYAVGIDGWHTRLQKGLHRGERFGHGEALFIDLALCDPSKIDEILTEFRVEDGPDQYLYVFRLLHVRRVGQLDYADLDNFAKFSRALPIASPGPFPYGPFHIQDGDLG